jgi:uncharacterized protein (TIGR02996 family)
VTSDTGFLLDMLERPDDPAPRLVLADWLEEHGQDDLAFCVRGACGVVAHPVKGGGWFAGLAFPAAARDAVRACLGYPALTARLARLAFRRAAV